MNKDDEYHSWRVEFRNRVGTFLEAALREWFERERHDLKTPGDGLLHVLYLASYAPGCSEASRGTTWLCFEVAEANRLRAIARQMVEGKETPC